MNRSGPFNTLSQSMARVSLAVAIASTTQIPAGLAADSIGFQLEEVVVTARRVTESAQDIPVAINVFDSQTAKDLNLSNVQNMVQFTPGATFASSFPGEQRLSIRGVSSGDGSASGGAGVLMMVDEEVIARDFMYSSATFDIARVEVLRGPQGTVYGRNAAGGVVHVINNIPTEDTEIYTKLNLGNYNLREMEMVINGSISDQVMARTAIFSRSKSGYSEDATTGNQVDDSDSLALRSSVLVDFSDDVDLLLRAHWSKDNKDNPAPRKLRDSNLGDGLGPISLLEPSQDPWTVSNSDNLYYDREIWGFSATVNWSTEHFDLTSITSFRQGEDQARVDLFGSPVDIVIQDSFNNAKTYSQEIRLNGSLDSAPLQWVTGFYYLHEDHERDELREIFSNNPTFQALGLELKQHFNQSNIADSFGLFGEINYDISDNTSLAIGLRYSYENKEYDIFHEMRGFDLTTANPLAAAIAFNAIEDPSQAVVGSTDNNWSSISGKISLTHQLSESSNVYFTLGNGTKSGGFNPEPYNLTALDQSYDEETVISTEIGFKSELMDHRLRLNASIFESNYADIQTVGFLSSGVSVIENGGEATIRGLEFDFVWMLTESLSLIGSYANYEAKYDNRMLDGVDLSGENLEEVPQWTGHIGAIYEHDLANDDRLRIRVDYRSRSDVLGLRDANIGELDRAGKDIINLSAGWLSADNRWEVTAWGENLGNQAEVLVSGPTGVFSQSRVTYGAPRTFGLSVAYHLN